MRLQGACTDHPYIHVSWMNWRVQVGNVHTYLHQGIESFEEMLTQTQSRKAIKKRRFLCRVRVWDRSYADGAHRYCLDYVPVQADKPTRMIRVVPPQGAKELPNGMCDPIISITLPKRAGFILIGNLQESNNS